MQSSIAKSPGEDKPTGVPHRDPRKPKQKDRNDPSADPEPVQALPSDLRAPRAAQIGWRRWQSIADLELVALLRQIIQERDQQPGAEQKTDAGGKPLRAVAGTVEWGSVLWV